MSVTVNGVACGFAATALAPAAGTAVTASVQAPAILPSATPSARNLAYGSDSAVPPPLRVIDTSLPSLFSASRLVAMAAAVSVTLKYEIRSAACAAAALAAETPLTINTEKAASLASAAPLDANCVQLRDSLGPVLRLMKVTSRSALSTPSAFSTLAAVSAIWISVTLELACAAFNSATVTPVTVTR